MFERQNSRIRLLITMDEIAQVVPTCTNIPSCVSDDHDELMNTARENDQETQKNWENGTTNFRNDARGAFSNERLEHVGQMTASEYTDFLELTGIKDQHLQEAARKALINNDMTPLIKEELKYSIQSKRLREGKGELKVEFTEPEPDQLTPEEVERVEKRKVQNRMAARRFRERQKTRGESLQKDVNRLHSEQTRLNHQLAVVTAERDKLRRDLESHLAICPLSVLPQLQIHGGEIFNDR